MVRSMTAFARNQAKGSWGSATWEIKSVNQRYLDIHFRLPEAFKYLEFKLREIIRKNVQRGKLDCSLKFELAVSQNARLTIDQSLAKQLIQAHDQLAFLGSTPASLDYAKLLEWPGLIQIEDNDTEAMEQDIIQGFEESLQQLIRVRSREGEAISQVIEQRLDDFSLDVTKIKSLLPTILEAQRERLKNRFAELSLEIEPERLEQEMVILAHKMDVEEELDRLFVHIKEVKRLLKAKGNSGRRFDFLMQELNRETNTLGSKSINAEVSSTVVNMKVLIEQMREQIQNIE